MTAYLNHKHEPRTLETLTGAWGGTHVLCPECDREVTLEDGLWMCECGWEAENDEEEAA